MLSDKTSQPSPGGAPAPPPGTSAYVPLVDIIFALVIGLSLDGFQEILVPPAPDIKTATLLLAFITIALSWIGYQYRIKEYPHQNAGRFILDLIILYMYFYLLNSVGNFTQFLIGYPVIFGLYLIWSKLLDREYPTRRRPTRLQRKVRIIRALVIFAAFLALWYGYYVSYSPSEPKIFLNGTLSQWAAWSVTLILVALYRIIPDIVDNYLKGCEKPQ